MSSHVFHQLYYHFVWGTKERLPFIMDETRDWLIARIENEVRARAGIVLACNAMPDHVHLFVSLPPTMDPANFVGQIKGVASHDYHQYYGPTHFLKWQNGYGVVTLRKGESNKVIRYVSNQQEIHATRKAWRTLETMTQD